MNESIAYLQGSQDWDALAFPVRILEEKNSYGVRRLLVEPVGGMGTKWVNASRVKNN